MHVAVLRAHKVMLQYGNGLNAVMTTGGVSHQESRWECGEGSVQEGFTEEAAHWAMEGSQDFAKRSWGGFK